MATLRKITVPEIDGKRFTLTHAAALCALSRFGRIFKDSQLKAWHWWMQRYVASWITPRRFFDNSKSYSIAFAICARQALAADGLVLLESDGTCCCSVAGNAIAAKIRAAMPEPLGETEFANARQQSQYERNLKRGFYAA